MIVHLLAIDPQRDFVAKTGSLCVPGADKDMDRLALMVRRLKDKLSDITLTQDSHRRVDISHPLWWVDSSGKHPSPFTMITVADMESGRWNTFKPGFRNRTLAYLKSLDSGKRYPHIIWPEHCLIGSEGHGFWPALLDSVHEWEGRFALANVVTKGSNMWTEHFSAVKAEVPDPEDDSTQVNTRLIETLEKADVILLAGEALSHCMANTVRDIASCFSNPDYVRKLVLLEDATTSVGDPPGTTMFTDMGKSFVSDMRKLGMQTSTTTDFLK